MESMSDNITKESEGNAQLNNNVEVSDKHL